MYFQLCFIQNVVTQKHYQLDAMDGDEFRCAIDWLKLS